MDGLTHSLVGLASANAGLERLSPYAVACCILSANAPDMDARDPRAQVLLGFARFPIAQLESDNCIGRTLVQFADLRYTEPGVSRGSFSLSVPVECPAP